VPQEKELSDAQKRFQMEKAGGNYGTGTKEMQVPFIAGQQHTLLCAATIGSGFRWRSEEGRGVQSGLTSHAERISMACTTAVTQRVCHHTASNILRPCSPQERNYVRRKEQEKEREQLFEGALKKFNAKDIEGVRETNPSVHRC
jgi:hypothetical protein